MENDVAVATTSGTTARESAKTITVLLNGEIINFNKAGIGRSKEGFLRDGQNNLTVVGKIHHGGPIRLTAFVPVNNGETKSRIEVLPPQTGSQNGDLKLFYELMIPFSASVNKVMIPYPENTLKLAIWEKASQNLSVLEIGLGNINERLQPRVFMQTQTSRLYKNGNDIFCPVFSEEFLQFVRKTLINDKEMAELQHFSSYHPFNNLFNLFAASLAFRPERGVVICSNPAVGVIEFITAEGPGAAFTDQLSTANGYFPVVGDIIKAKTLQMVSNPPTQTKSRTWLKPIGLPIVSKGISISIEN